MTDIKSEIKGERIAKRIANAGLCSRRDAERWIDMGRVAVDGRLIDTAALVVFPHQSIVVDGVSLREPSRARLWGYAKPTGIITTHKDPQGRPTVFEQLPEHMPRVISIGRLDLNSEGIILLTTDGELARHAELPKTGWARQYRVRVYGDLNLQDLEDLKNGIEIEGVQYGRINVDVTRETGRNSWLFITIFEGKNREIRRVLQHLGLHVNRLIRVSYGPFALDQHQIGDLWEIPFSMFGKHFPHLKDTKGPLELSRKNVRPTPNSSSDKPRKPAKKFTEKKFTESKTSKGKSKDAPHRR